MTSTLIMLLLLVAVALWVASGVLEVVYRIRKLQMQKKQQESLENSMNMLKKIQDVL